MTNIEKLIQIEIAKGKENVLYQVLGHFGDRLPKDVAKEIRQMAEDEHNNSVKFLNKVGKTL